MGIFSFVAVPLGWIMWFIYQYIPNYGITLVLFTILMKVIMLPLAVSQQKGMVKMAQFNPKVQAIQKKYAKDKSRMNEEINKLYEQENYNPMASCLPTLIQLPVMFGLMGVIYYPLTHILRLPEGTIEIITTLTKTLLPESRSGMEQINALHAVLNHTASFVESVGQEVADLLMGFDFSFLGIFLGDTPNWKQPSILWVVPIASGLLALLSSWQSARNSKATSAGNPSANSMNSSMMLTMPLMSTYISFIMPVGVGLYWALSSAITVIQTFILHKIYNPTEIIRKAKEEEEAEKEAARQSRIEAKKARGMKVTDADLSDEIDLSNSDDLVPEYIGLSQKEINRLKLAAARKRDAERYGEEYVEVTDDDLT